MNRIIAGCTLLIACSSLFAQKKPLDHTVYDSWQSIGERMISNDGKWVVYTVCPQEGDTTLVIQQPDNKYKNEVARGFNAVITEDSRFVIFKIRPFQKDLREARIKNKKPDDFPKDTLGIIELGKDPVIKIPKLNSYKTPAKAGGWVAWRLEKARDTTTNSEGSDLLLKNLNSGDEKTFKLVTEYYFDKKGTKLLIETAPNNKDSSSRAFVLLYHLQSGRMDTLSRGGTDFRAFVFDEDGNQLAYVAERDAEPKALQKFYRLWYYKAGMDSAVMLLDRNSVGMRVGMTVSENGSLSFSKSGRRLFFGVAPIQPPKDTTLIESELVKLDIWNYNDDYLQTQQLVQLNNELRRSYLTVYDLEKNSIRQLGSPEIQQVIQTNEGDGDTFIGITDYGKRKESQWLGTTRKDIYAMDVNSGSKKMVKQNLFGQVYPSSTGKYIMWYDRPAKNYFVWDSTSVKNISARIKVPLYNEKYDTPDAPSPYGVMGWHEGDSAVYVYDRYDIWKIFFNNLQSPQKVFAYQALRSKRTAIRYVQTNPDERVIKSTASYVYRLYNENYKSTMIWETIIQDQKARQLHVDAGFSVSTPVKASGANKIIFTKENFIQSSDLYLQDYTNEFPQESKLTSLNPQQKDYLWGTAELFKWKTFNGKESEGILYKPENFDPAKKYPVLIYFYEELSDGLNEYIEPAPPRSSINVTYFVSNGYVVFYPDIRYGTGHPGKDAYDFVVSGAKALIAKYKWVDANHIGIQGHSWGGYQVSYLITKTNMFKAAWAGAPVVNMTSAYGGIRYGTGVNRQFQYEKGQSRIGKNLWEALPQYMESSPLFSLNKVSTPVVILHNDNDDAVPYTQGLEMFTALKRLNKKAWLICYNGEPHGVIQRKNRKDLAIRFEQYFGWLLKNEKPAKWLIEGVPAIKKGKDWGLEIE